MDGPAALGDVAHLDLADPAVSLRSAVVRQARARSWYATTPFGLAVLRYDAVKELLRDRRLRQGSWAWPQKNGVTDGPFHAFWSQVVLNLEGEQHAALRRLHNQAFAHSAAAALVPRFRELAGELADGLAGDGRCDFVGRFAGPYAARAAALVVGLPEQDWSQLLDWCSTIGLALTVEIRERLPEVETALAELYDYLRPVLADAGRRPGTDLISRLVAAGSGGDGTGMPTQQVLQTAAHGIFAALETTRNQLGLGMQLFLDHPDQWELLAHRPELAGPAVEEIMRLAPTSTWVTREALVDLEYRGVPIPAGTTLHLLTEAAGTDPDAYPEPGFDLTAAARPPHAGFGGGAHYCAGHFVARADMAQAFGVLASRITGITAEPGAQWLPVSGNTGPLRLPIAYRARG